MFVETLLERNREFAKAQSTDGGLKSSLPAQLPKVKAVVIGCADMRVDPAHVLGLEPGEAVVMRNIGGRVTPELLQQLGMLGRIGQVAGEVPGGGGEFNLVVLQHTDCGITRLAGDPDLLVPYFQAADNVVEAKSVLNPRAAVQTDIAVLRSIEALPASWMVSGLVYDVSTGLVQTVVAPTALRSS